MSSLNFNYTLGVDGVSLFLVLLTTFLMPAGILVSWKVEHQVKTYFLAFLVLETAMIGSFLALDLLLFFFFFEALLVPDVPDHRRVGERAADLRRDQVLPLHDGRLGVPAGRRSCSSTSCRVAARPRDLRLRDAASTSRSRPATARWLFLGFFVAFAVKTPLVPAAHVAARRPHRGPDGRARSSWPPSSSRSARTA